MREGFPSPGWAFNGRTVTLVGEGTTTLTATQAATPNYLTGTVSVTLVVSRRSDIL